MSGKTSQRIASSIGNLLCLNFGFMFGITPAHVRLYQSVETPLYRLADANAANWVAGYLFIFCAVGALLAGFIMQKLGPKSVLMMCGLLEIFSWFTLHFSYDIVHVHFSRIFAGLAAGATFVALPIYIAEITQEPDYCVVLTISIDIWRSAGILIGFILSTYLRYDYIAIIGICLSILFKMLFPFVQESPYHYLRTDNVHSMEKSLRWFRGIRDLDDRTKPEFLREVDDFKSQMHNQPFATSHMSRCYLAKIWIFSAVLAIGAQMTGVLIILNYAATSFLKTVDIFTSEANVFILAAMHFIGALLALCILDRIKRKILLFVTTLICGLCLLSMVIYLNNTSQWHVSWLLLCLLSMHMLFANIGVYPLSTIIINEILPEHLRIKLTSLLSVLSWLVIFAFVQGFNIITINIGEWGCLCIFAGICFTLAIFSLCILPETHGKPFKEVQVNMGYVANGNVANLNVIERF